ALEAARAAKIPLPLMRGDFIPLGWVLIQGLAEKSAYLDHHGVGREIRFTVNLLRVGSPSAGMAASILRLFL
ncbi:phage tail protein, partial [Cupriavidus sp. IK-TO18]